MFFKLLMIACIMMTQHMHNAMCILWLLPEADICSNDGYFFKNETKCMYAKGRDNYCKGIDGHLCGLRDSGNYTGYYQVECG